MKEAADEGDVVAIPIDDKVSVGQVVRARGGIILLCVFPDLFAVDVVSAIEDEYFSTPIYLVGTMDNWIEDGRWQIVGRRQVADTIAVPRYKVEIGSSGTFRVQEFGGALGEEISREVAASLRSPKTYSPATVVKAIRAYHDLDVWERRFEDFVI
ncbi:hypothetical protein ACFS27_04315 [Promicromonospora vindobonensis]|uniref:Immunity protein 26 of polymorphic toxin system n=1 Tax=Promicromonospora vindobonensis TaxID=195748 RepID=A0ABW5VNI2_9MICO